MRLNEAKMLARVLLGVDAGAWSVDDVLREAGLATGVQADGAGAQGSGDSSSKADGMGLAPGDMELVQAVMKAAQAKAGHWDKGDTETELDCAGTRAKPGQRFLWSRATKALRKADAGTTPPAAAEAPAPPERRPGIRESPFAKVVDNGVVTPIAPVPLPPVPPPIPLAPPTTPPCRTYKRKLELESRGTTRICWTTLSRALFKDGLPKVLGVGSSGQVLRAQWQGQRVAVKLVTLQEDTAEVQEGFEQEVRIHQQLSHTNIVQLLGVAYEDTKALTHEYIPQTLAIVMELCDCNLLQMIRQAARALDEAVTAKPSSCKPWPSRPCRFHSSWPLRLEVAHGIAAGLQHMHDKQCVHRDLTSYNVLLQQQQGGRLIAKLCDFNYSKGLAHGRCLVKSDRDANSPRWQSPEVLRGGTYSHATDVFSFGVILWEIVTLKLPWMDECPNPAPHGDQRLWLKLMQEVPCGARLPLPAVSELQPPLTADGVATTLLDTIRSCWHDEPLARPTAKDLMHSLGLLLDKTKAWDLARAA